MRTNVNSIKMKQVDLVTGAAGKDLVIQTEDGQLKSHLLETVLKKSQDEVAWVPRQLVLELLADELSQNIMEVCLKEACEALLDDDELANVTQRRVDRVLGEVKRLQDLYIDYVKTVCEMENGSRNLVIFATAVVTNRRSVRKSLKATIARLKELAQRKEKRSQEFLELV